MTNGGALRDAIARAGVSITFLAGKIGCSRNRIYAIIAGADCTATGIAGFTQNLHLTKEERDHIFLEMSVN